jgi:uncharacterized peroxidase-related enzyme
MEKFRRNRMPVLTAVDTNTASARTKELLSVVESKLKKVPNMISLMANSPAILNAFLQFNQAFDETKLSPKLRALIGVVVSEINCCEYSLSTAFAFGPRHGVSETDLIRARRAEADDPKIAAALVFAARVVLQNGRVPASEVEELIEAGFSGEEMVEIVGVVALNVFKNYFNLVAGTDVDFPLVKASNAA